MRSSRAAFTGRGPAFAENPLNSAPRPITIEIEAQQMRLFYPGQILVPMILILTGALLVMTRFDIIQVVRFQHLWPVTLIAAGLEQLYLWARDDR